MLVTVAKTLRLVAYEERFIHQIGRKVALTEMEMLLRAKAWTMRKHRPASPFDDYG